MNGRRKNPSSPLLASHSRTGGNRTSGRFIALGVTLWRWFGAVSAPQRHIYRRHGQRRSNVLWVVRHDYRRIAAAVAEQCAGGSESDRQVHEGPPAGLLVIADAEGAG